MGKKVEDSRFESFLKKQFAELKRELGQYPAPGAVKDGKLLQISQTPQAKASASGALGSWKYGIAAAVLVAVAVPSIIRFNQQKTELASKTESPFMTPKEEKKSEAPETKNNKLPTRDLNEREESQNFRKAKKKIAGGSKGQADQLADSFAGERNDGNLKGSKEEASAYVTGKADLSKNEVTKDSVANAVRDGEMENAKSSRSVAQAGASADESGYLQSKADKTPPAKPAAPAAAPAPSQAVKKSAEITTAAAPSAPASEAMSADRRSEVTSAGSASVDDAKTRGKKQEVSENETAEMERLWREFEKNPQTFNKDKTRRSRLDVLLARHDRKSRAKRMRAIESQKAY